MSQKFFIVVTNMSFCVILLCVGMSVFAYDLSETNLIAGITSPRIIFLHSIELTESIYCVIKIPLGLRFEFGLSDS